MSPSVASDKLIDHIIAIEGGYVDNPADKGGPTKFGVTMPTLAAFRGHPVTSADVFNLSIDEARAIYQKMFIEEPGFSGVLDDALRAFLVDSGIQHGPQRAVKWLQKALRVKQDGTFGEETFKALQTADVYAVYRKVAAIRARFYGTILQKESQRVFASGWLNRLAEALES